MVNKNLVKRLLKELEAEKGCPVQLTLDSPDSLLYYGDISRKEFFGDFNERKVKVTRVDGLKLEYEKDISLIEGDYSSFRELNQKIIDYNVLFGRPTRNSTAYSALEILEKEFPDKRLVHNNISFNFDKIGRDRIEDILRKNNIVYFEHDLILNTNGIYSDYYVDIYLGIKIADVRLDLIE